MEWYHRLDNPLLSFGNGWWSCAMGNEHLGFIGINSAKFKGVFGPTRNCFSWDMFLWLNITNKEFVSSFHLFRYCLLCNMLLTCHHINGLIRGTAVNDLWWWWNSCLVLIREPVGYMSAGHCLASTWNLEEICRMRGFDSNKQTIKHSNLYMALKWMLFRIQIRLREVENIARTWRALDEGKWFLKCVFHGVILILIQGL